MPIPPGPPAPLLFFGVAVATIAHAAWVARGPWASHRDGDSCAGGSWHMRVGAICSILTPSSTLDGWLRCSTRELPKADRAPLPRRQFLL